MSKKQTEELLKKRKVAYIGGFWDYKNKFVKSFYEAYGKESDVYFEHYQKKALASWIDENKSECSLTVIGHSYGANSAARVVAKGHRVDRLITIDPVGRFKPNLKNVAKFSGAWTNYIATGGGIFNRNNLVARAGSRYGHKPKIYADQHISVDKDHVAIFYQCCSLEINGELNKSI